MAANPEVTQEIQSTQIDWFRIKQCAARIGLIVGLGLSGAASSEIINATDSPAIAEETGGYPWADAQKVPQPPAADNITWGYKSKSTCDSKSASYDCSSTTLGSGSNKWYYKDQWGFDLRNCTSFAAWSIAQTFGISIPGSWGDAKNWDSAANGKYEVDSIPQINDAAVWDGGKHGHVGIVSATRKMQNGSFQVKVRQYNKSLDGRYSQSNWTTANHYIDFDGSTPTTPDPNAEAGSLIFVKTKDTGSGKVEIHTKVPSKSYKDGIGVPTRFSPADSDRGWFQVANSDLYFIKTKGTTNGRIEVHTATRDSKFNGGKGYSSAFETRDANNGWFQMSDVDGDKKQDLVFIKTKNPSSGRVEFFWASGANEYKSVDGSKITPLSPADADNGWFQARGGDLVFIKTKNTGSRMVEFFTVPRSKGYKEVVNPTVTDFSPADADNGWFSAEDINRDGVADLAFIKTRNTTSGQIEFFWDNGLALSNHDMTVSAITNMSPANQNNGWFQVDSKQ